jgi:hypothetical protein
LLGKAEVYGRLQLRTLHETGSSRLHG